MRIDDDLCLPELPIYATTPIMMKKDDDLITADRRKLEQDAEKVHSTTQDEAISSPLKKKYSEPSKKSPLSVRTQRHPDTGQSDNDSAQRRRLSHGGRNCWTTGYPCFSPDPSK